MSIFLILLMMLSIKKKDFVGYIEKIKSQVVAHKQTLKLCSEIANLSDNVKSLVNTSERLTNEITITKNVSKILEIRNVNLEKDLSKNDQYGRRNNFEISEKSKSRPREKDHQNLQRLGYQYTTYGYQSLLQTSSTKECNQPIKTSNCQIC